MYGITQVSFNLLHYDNSQIVSINNVLDIMYLATQNVVTFKT